MTSREIGEGSRNGSPTNASAINSAPATKNANSAATRRPSSIEDSGQTKCDAEVTSDPEAASRTIAASPGEPEAESAEQQPNVTAATEEEKIYVFASQGRRGVDCLVPSRSRLDQIRSLEAVVDVADEGTGRVLGVTYCSSKLNAWVIDLTSDLDECGLINTTMSNYGATADFTLTQTITVTDCELTEESVQGVTFCAVPPCAPVCGKQERRREDECSDNREDRSGRQKHESGVDGCEDDSGADGHEDDSGVDELKDDDGQDDSETETDDEDDQGLSTDDEADILVVAGSGTGPVSC
ncbi:unnamed protein product [Phytophthora fragariaefolia]|uniref:Unnamed protein product n=1 Tax=Phytophthora fragariaefolia TaxID=1490495 RepID=A0A9W6XL76_9STRA|nr:unnamed protein product [Phytophthora fragariaefolia]